MKEPLWKPSEERIKNANMTRFIEFVNRKHGKQFDTYDELYQWSIENIPDFWESMWEFGEIKASHGFETVVDDLNKMPGAKWFTGARLNFAEVTFENGDVLWQSALGMFAGIGGVARSEHPYAPADPSRSIVGRGSVDPASSPPASSSRLVWSLRKPSSVSRASQGCRRPRLVCGRWQGAAQGALDHLLHRGQAGGGRAG